MEIDLKNIQKIIGYDFENVNLLKQAFIRTSYSEEFGGPDNQILEFIGDRALDVAVIRILTITYGEIKELDGFKGYYLKNKEYYKSKFNEGDFSKIKQELVEGKFLSNCITNLGLHNYLIFGSSETSESLNDNEAAKEDLFEAILGAVALDSDWNPGAITYVADVMLDIDSYIFHRDLDEDKYLLILQEWSIKNNYGLPVYSYDYLGHCVFTCKISFSKNNNYEFIGEGRDEPDSRRKAAKNAYFELYKKGLIVNQFREACGNPDWHKSLEQINILVSKKMIQIPEFKCSSQYDENGNETWNCTLTNEGCARQFYVYCAPNKTEARKECAFEYLRYIMDEFDYEG